ncbi:MAG: hypothetical protein AAF363_17910 [Bacteroidota bacterium]
MLITSLWSLSKKPFISPLDKIKGVNLVAPPNPFTAQDLEPLKAMGNEWVSIVPYAFSKPNQSFVRWGSDRQWWGEKPDGVKQSIKMAREKGFRIMLKPHVWVIGQGWAGDFDIDMEAEWKKWEEEYSSYILTYAEIAEEYKIDLLCVGTEYRIAAKERPEFWKSLIVKVRQKYSGNLTYAANWDNYENVKFWGELDYIGIDAYFPLSENENPKVDELISKWRPIETELKNFSDSVERKVIFTEYGYRSIDYAASGHWTIEEKATSINQEAQKNSYEAMYKALGDSDWYIGGFLWKWFPDHENAGGSNCDRFTPQNKKVEEIIKNWNKKS